MKYSEIILNTHAQLPKSELTDHELTLFRSDFTVHSRYDYNKKVPVYTETATHFGVPLHAINFSDLSANVVDKRSLGQPLCLNMVEGFQFREDQQLCMEQFHDALRNNLTGFLVSLGTGGGKTVLCAAMMQELDCTTLIIVPRENLVQQWKERLLEFTTLKENEIGIAQGSTCDYEAKKVVIGMIHTLCKDKFSDEFKNSFGLVVWDEVHTAGAETFSQTVGMFPARFRVGMSATPLRKDGMDRIYELSMGGTKIGPKKITTLVSPKVYLHNYVCKKKNSFVSRLKDPTKRSAILLSVLAKDSDRNAIIADYTKRLSATGRRTLVLSARIEQLNQVQESLIGEHGVDANDIGLFVGGIKEDTRKHILENSKIILATTGVMSMGVDVPDLRAIVFATPSSDVAQAVGRILRICEGTQEPIVLDIIDQKYEDCQRWASYRQQYYRDTAQAEIISIN